MIQRCVNGSSCVSAQRSVSGYVANSIYHVSDSVDSSHHKCMVIV